MSGAPGWSADDFANMTPQGTTPAPHPGWTKDQFANEQPKPQPKSTAAQDAAFNWRPFNMGVTPGTTQANDQLGSALVRGLASIPGLPADLFGLSQRGAAYLAGDKRPQVNPLEPWGGATFRDMVSNLPGMAPETHQGLLGYIESAGQFAGQGGGLGGTSRAVVGGLTGGLGAQAGHDIAPDTWWAPAAGGLLAGALPALSETAGAAMIPKTTAPRAQLAQELMDRGVPVFPGQLATSEMTRRGYNLASKFAPLDMGSGERQSEALNRVVAGSMGSDADTITPGVMAAAKSRLGQTFQNVFGRNTVPIGDSTLQDLGDIQAQAQKNLTADQMKAVQHGLDAVMNEASARGGSLPGETYHAFTSTGGALSSLTNNADSNIAFYGRKIRDALDNSFMRTASPEDAALLRQTKQQYGNMKTIQPLAARSPEGDVSMGRLMTRVAANDPNSAYTGGGDLGLLGKAGSSFLKPPSSSGTFENSLLGGGAAVGLEQALHGNYYPLVAAAGTGAMAQGTKGIMESQWLARLMIQKALADQAARKGVLSTIGSGAANATALNPALPGLLQLQPPQRQGLLN